MPLRPDLGRSLAELEDQLPALIEANPRSWPRPRRNCELIKEPA